MNDLGEKSFNLTSFVCYNKCDAYYNVLEAGITKGNFEIFSEISDF